MDIPQQEQAACCGGSAGPTRFRPVPVAGSVPAAGRDIPVIAPHWSWKDRLGAVGVRLDISRNDYAVAPGLYAFGRPGPASPVIATANYKLTFDIVRRSCAGLDLWVLVLDTKGINVWCAAGKGTFGTMELCGRVLKEKLADVVTHRTVIVPQLGAPGVAGHLVDTFADFSVVFGPVRIQDLPRFLAAGMRADASLRRVTFTVRERLVVSFLELALAARWGAFITLLVGIGAAIAVEAGVLSAAAVAAAVILCALLWTAIVAGTVVTAVVLPWVPFTSFALSGGIVGTVAAAGLLALPGVQPDALTRAALVVLSGVIAAYLALNFTGNSTYTSLSGVRREMRYALPSLGGGLALTIVLLAMRGFV